MDSEKWTSRGTGTCPSCQQYNYVNRHKPPKCPDCGRNLGGSFTGTKKAKKTIPDAVAITKNIFSVRTSNRGDRCFVCKDNNLWICLHEKCKERRAFYHASGKLHEFSCDHTKKASNPVSPLASYSPEKSNVCEHPCGEKIKVEILSLVDSALKHNYPLVSKVSDNVYSIYGPPTASNTVGFCHVKQHDEKLSFVCSGKDCHGVASK